MRLIAPWIVIPIDLYRKSLLALVKVHDAELNGNMEINLPSSPFSY
jgi:hypothetical protein